MDRTTHAKVKPFLDTADPPELGPGPRAGVNPLDSLSRRLEAALKGATLKDSSRNLIKAVVLLWHDHLHASHVLSQQEEGADGSYVHGIMHRREPDYGNAKYWFRRVGRHQCFTALARRVEALSEEGLESGLGARLVPGGHWDAFAMVDICQELEGRPDQEAQVRWARRIQALELDILLEHLCS